MDLYGEIGVSQEAMAEVKPQEVSTGFVVPSAIYDAKVEEAYLRKTESGATMLQVAFKIVVGEEPTDYMYMTCVKSGDKKGNKATYTDKQGKERTLPGIHEMKHFTDACGVEKPVAEVGKVKYKDEIIDALCVPGLTGKEIKIALRQEENLYQGDVSLKNDLFAFMTSEGKNVNGDDITENAQKLIDKNPIKKLKAGTSSGPSTGATGAIDQDAAKKSGWS